MVEIKNKASSPEFISEYQQAERAFLSALLTSSREEIETLGQVDPLSFRFERDQDLFQVCMSQILDSGKADPVLIIQKLGHKHKLISSQIDNLKKLQALPVNLPSFARALKDFRFVNEFHLLAESASHDKKEEMAQVAYKLIEQWRSIDEEFNMAALIESTIKTVQEARSKSLYDTGIEVIDEILGGFRKGHLYTIGARPSNGKTAFAVTTAYNLLKKNAPVLFESIEMTSEEILNRLVSIDTGMEYQQIHVGDFTDADWRCYGDSIYAFRKRPLVIFDKKIDSEEIHRHIRRYRPAVVFIDYIQIMFEKHYTDQRRNAQIAQTVNQLKNLAKNEDVAIVIMSQIHRMESGKEPAKPQLNNLKESGAIEEASDAVILLHSPYVHTHESNDKDKMEVWIAKNRHGRIGRTVLKWYPEQMRVGQKLESR